MAQGKLYADIEASLRDRCTLLFAHGFNIHYGQIKPRADLDVVLIAPKGPGDLVRRQYEIGRGVPCLVAVAQDATGKAQARALAYAHGIGGTRGGVLATTFAEETETDLFGEQAVLCGGATALAYAWAVGATRAGVIATSFPEEVETDLFGEQAVLCGGISELMKAGFETLVEAGYQPEVAYFECMHEMKLIVDLLHEGGLKKMHEFISETAKFGDLTRGPRIIDAHVKENMRAVLAEVRDGTFAREWVAESEAGLPKYKKLLQEDLENPIETVGKALRARMTWLQE